MLYEQNPVKKGFGALLQDHPVIAPCVYDCVSASLVARLGFEAMCLSGGELAASLVGVPDIGLVTQDELVGAVQRISDSTNIPMIADIDTGFGNELNLIRTCKRVAHAGAKAVHLEDQTFPKRCGHLKGKQVIPHDEYIGKVKAAAWALKDTDCLLIARTDSYHILGFDEAVSRCNDAIDAGADITFIEGCGTLKDIERAGQLIKGWKMFAMMCLGASPKVAYDQLIDWGYNLITMHFAMGGACRGIMEVGSKCFEAKSDIPIADYVESDKKWGATGFSFNLTGLNNWLELGKQFNKNIETAYVVRSKE